MDKLFVRITKSNAISRYEIFQYGPGFIHVHSCLFAANEPPVISLPPNVWSLNAQPGADLSLPLTATDPNEDAVTFTLVTSLTGTSIDPGSGVLQWVNVPELEPGTGITVQAADTKGASSSITVNVQYCPCKVGTLLILYRPL